MTELLEKAIREIGRLPRDRQDIAAEMLLSFAAQESDKCSLTPEQIAEVERRLAEPPEYATDEEVQAVFERLLR